MLVGARVLACLVGLSVFTGAFANESAYQKFPATKEALAAQCKELNPYSAADRKQYALADTTGEFLCAGYKSYKVLKKSGSMTSMQFGYLSDSIVEEYFESFTIENVVGDTIEWRLDDQGVPRAAIVRYKMSAYVDLDGKTKPGDSILVISKVGQPDSPVGCAVGLVNASVNTNANEIARQVADEIEPHFACGQDPAEYHGETDGRQESFTSSWPTDH